MSRDEFLRNPFLCLLSIEVIAPALKAWDSNHFVAQANFCHVLWRENIYQRIGGCT